MTTSGSNPGSPRPRKRGDAGMRAVPRPSGTDERAGGRPSVTRSDRGARAPRGNATGGGARAASSPRSGAASASRAARPGLAWLVALAILFAIALVWRVSYIQRLALTPLGGSLIEDAEFYWNWAGYLLRHGFVGARPFFLAPLYPYLLALMRMPFGDSVQAVLMVQAVWGSAAVVLIADAARRLTRPGVGLAVGALAAFYESAVFFDGLILMESLLFFLECLLLWWVVARADRTSRWSTALIAGLLIGVLAEGRATSTVLLVPAALWLIGGARAGGLRPIRPIAILFAGFLCVTAPVAIRNFAVGHEWIPFTYNLGFNLYAGNSPEANGAFTSITRTHRASSQREELMEAGAQADGREYLRKVEGVDLSPAASSAWWSKQAVAWIRTHPGRTFGLALRKLTMMWNREEYAQIENVREFHDVAGPIGLPIAGQFLFVGALAFAGLLLSWRGAPGARFASGYAVLMTFSIVPFFVTDRYRFHLVPAALLLAGLTLERVWRAYRGHDRASTRPLVLALAAGLIVVNLPAPRLGSAKYEWGVAADLGARWARRGRNDLAVEQYERALQLERSSNIGAIPGHTAATERSDLWYNYGNALSRLGRRDEAMTAYQRAVEAGPDRAQAIRALGDAHAAHGDVGTAESLYNMLPSKVGGDGAAAAGRGFLAARAGRLAAAESLFAQAVRHDPTLVDAWGALIRIQVQQNRTVEARATLERARAAGVAGAPLLGHEALLDALEGRRTEASNALDRIPAAALTADPTLADVVRVTRGLLAGGR